MQPSRKKNKSSLEKLDELFAFYCANFKLNLTQFARLLGCSYSQIRKLYIYRHNPGFKTRILIDTLYEKMNTEKKRSYKKIKEKYEKQRQKDLAFTLMYLNKKED